MGVAGQPERRADVFRELHLGTAQHQSDKETAPPRTTACYGR